MTAECESEEESGRRQCSLNSSRLENVVPLCNHHYKFVDGLAEFESNQTCIPERAHEYCVSIGGVLGAPRCVTNWVPLVHKFSKAEFVWVGLYFGDLTLPNMYRQELSSRDRSILHHGVQVLSGGAISKDMCFASYSGMMIVLFDCCEHSEKMLSYGAVCELKTKMTNSHDDYNPSTIISFVNVSSPSLEHHQSLHICTDGGHVTHTFLLCGSSQYKVCDEENPTACVFTGLISNTHRTSRSTKGWSTPVALFSCRDATTVVSYTLVCNMVTDCPDNSDESFCRHSVCVLMFSCTNGQCVSYDNVCDRVAHCHDQSDEIPCIDFRYRVTWPNILPPPIRVDFDGSRTFTSISMNLNESCPESHYRCPGVWNDCLPVYTRCNEVYDCLDHQDENGCEEVSCPGLLKCGASRLCVHADHLCDGWPHCPMHDDELSCGVLCPPQCLCQGHTFLCTQPFSAASFPSLRFLDVTGSGMTLSDVTGNSFLIHLIFSHCALTRLHSMPLFNLKFLDLSSNQLQRVNVSYFVDLKNLESLILSNNPVTLLHSDHSSDVQHRTLVRIDLSQTSLQVFDSKALAVFTHLRILNLSFTDIYTISTPGFQYITQLKELYMDNSPVKRFPSSIFEELSNLLIISTQNYKLCCDEILPKSDDAVSCYAPKDELSSCEDLVQSWVYRGALWLFASLSLTGNMLCFCTRLFTKSLSSSSGYSVFVTNLTIADFLMGMYICIIGIADEVFRGHYFYHDDTWKSSVTCKTAGFLSLLSSEVSAFIIWLITLDRFLVVCFPFSNVRFQKRSAVMASLIIWLIGWLLALLPLLPITSHWEFYSQTGICIPLPVTRQEFKGRLYSVGVLIVLNFFLFLLISAGQGLIYCSIKKNTMRTSSTKVSQDMTIARRLITIAVTDFLCWFPIGLCGILASAGVPIPGDVNVALAVVVLPLNSAINPFIYTLNTIAEKRKKSNEARLLKWLQSCSDLALD